MNTEHSLPRGLCRGSLCLKCPPPAMAHPLPFFPVETHVLGFSPSPCSVLFSLALATSAHHILHPCFVSLVPLLHTLECPILYQYTLMHPEEGPAWAQWSSLTRQQRVTGQVFHHFLSHHEKVWDGWPILTILYHLLILPSSSCLYLRYNSPTIKSIHLKCKSQLCFFNLERCMPTITNLHSMMEGRRPSVFSLWDCSVFIEYGYLLYIYFGLIIEDAT